MVIDKLKSRSYIFDISINKIIEDHFNLSLYVKLCNNYDISRISNFNFELDNIEINEIKYVNNL